MNACHNRGNDKPSSCAAVRQSGQQVLLVLSGTLIKIPEPLGAERNYRFGRNNRDSEGDSRRSGPSRMGWPRALEAEDPCSRAHGSPCSCLTERIPRLLCSLHVQLRVFTAVKWAFRCSASATGVRENKSGRCETSSVFAGAVLFGTGAPPDSSTFTQPPFVREYERKIGASKIPFLLERRNLPLIDSVSATPSFEKDQRGSAASSKRRSVPSPLPLSNAPRGPYRSNIGIGGGGSAEGPQRGSPSCTIVPRTSPSFPFLSTRLPILYPPPPPHTQLQVSTCRSHLFSSLLLVLPSPPSY